MTLVLEGCGIGSSRLASLTAKLSVVSTNFKSAETWDTCNCRSVVAFVWATGSNWKDGAEIDTVSTESGPTESCTSESCSFSKISEYFSCRDFEFVASAAFATSGRGEYDTGNEIL